MDTTITNIDEHRTERSTLDAVCSLRECADNGTVSFGAEADNLGYLRIKALRYEYLVKVPALA